MNNEERFEVAIHELVKRSRHEVSRTTIERRLKELGVPRRRVVKYEQQPFAGNVYHRVKRKRYLYSVTQDELEQVIA